MNRLSTADRVRVIAALVEGNSINSTVRMTGISKPTILKLVAELGDACREHHDETVRNVKATRVQCDEVWSFCYAKARNVPQAKKGDGSGDVWTWTALDADSKLIVSYMVTGDRQMGAAMDFMRDVANRVEPPTGRPPALRRRGRRGIRLERRSHDAD